MSRILIAVLPWILLAIPPFATAQEDAGLEASRRAHALSSEVMSPYCPGRTLTDCPSPDAAALRDEIRGLIASGVGDDAIRQDLERRFGGAVIGVPRSAWGWLVPILVLLAGAGVVLIALRRVSRVQEDAEDREETGNTAPSQRSTPAAGVAEELDAELESRGL